MLVKLISNWISFVLSCQLVTLDKSQGDLDNIMTAYGLRVQSLISKLMTSALNQLNGADGITGYGLRMQDSANKFMASVLHQLSGTQLCVNGMNNPRLKPVSPNINFGVFNG